VVLDQPAFLTVKSFIKEGTHYAEEKMAVVSNGRSCSLYFGEREKSSMGQGKLQGGPDLVCG